MLISRLLSCLLPSAVVLAVFVALLGSTTPANAGADRTVVRFETVEGTFDVELYDDLMPRTVANFLDYVQAERYDGSVVHRAADTAPPNPMDFVVQGGGFFLHDPDPPDPDASVTFSNVVTNAPILDEPGGGIAGPSNVRGTIAMAKSGPDTVTSQWFINQDDNSILDDPQRDDGGFSAFGVVLDDGMTVVDAIGALPLPPDFGFTIGLPFNDLPLRNFSGSMISDVREINTVVVQSITVVPEPSAAVLAAASLGTLLVSRRRALPSRR